MDWLVTGVAVVATVVPVALTEPLAWWAVALVVLASAPVLWLRRWPVPVGALVGIAVSVLAILHLPPLVPAGPLVAVYEIAANGTRLVRLVSVAVTLVGTLTSLVLPGEHDTETYRYLAAAYVAAYALGTSTRARRAQAVVVEERARAAAAAERARIARELHDIVTHSVGMMIVQAEAGPLLVRAEPGRAEAVFDTIADTGRAAVVQLRQSVGALRSAGVADIPALVDGTGLVVDLACDGAPRPVPPEVDVTAYRVVQESLTNTVRHAGATAVRVRLGWTEHALDIDVIDNGRGPAGTRPGFGLIGMRERVTACGGTLATGPGPEGGFAVRASLPLGRP